MDIERGSMTKFLQVATTLTRFDSNLLQVEDESREDEQLFEISHNESRSFWGRVLKQKLISSILAMDLKR